MKLLLLFSLLTLPYLLQAQSFVPAPFPVEGNLPLDGMGLNSIAFTDIDGDADIDLLMIGMDNSHSGVAKLYSNTRGVFTEVTKTPFEGTVRNSIAVADIDGDNDQDLLLTGLNNSSDYISKLYTNDGKGGFREIGNPFEGVLYSSVAFADIDGDNDQDLLITGETWPEDLIAELYINDGKGRFTEMSNTPFEGVNFSSVAFADVDGDNDQDLLLTGKNRSLVRVAKLYTNDGKGRFTEITNTPLEGVSVSSIAFADIDGDNDQDLLLTGLNNSSDHISKLYANDGNGGFTEMADTPLEGVMRSAVAFADFDGDNDLDILITGQNNSSEPIAKLYANNGKGKFTEMINTPLAGVFFGSIALADIDIDNDQDLLITGFDSSDAATAMLYINMLKTSSFVERSSTSEENLPQLFPNPSVNAVVALSYFAEKFGNLSISVSDAAGKTLLRHQVAVSKGENTIPLDCADLPKGTYIVELKQGASSTSTKLVLQ